MSSELQLKGDSLRRQLVASEQYAAKHGLELAEPIRDEGVSAYRGANRAFGNLRRFLDLIREGKVERGSYLIIESLDRLSRQNVLLAFSLFGEIVQNGICIVTLMDGQVYTEESFAENQGQVFIALGSMLRAHEESKVKSKRLIEAWNNKRANALIKPMTRRMPAWLRLNESNGRIKLLPDRARVIRQIFRWARDGYGGYSIARKLNERKESTWHSEDSGGKHALVWYESYIKKILGNRAVLGELQPHRATYIDGSQARRVAACEPIPEYYPRVVDDDLFLAVQAATKGRRVGGRGRKGPALTNLFSGLLWCGYCGMPVRFWNRGPEPKGGRFIVCTSSWHKAGCAAPSWRYPQFEEAFLRFLRNVDLKAVIGGKDRDDALAAIRAQLLRLEHDIQKITKKLGNLTDALADSEDRGHLKVVIEKIRELESQQDALTVEETAAQLRLVELLASRAVMDESELATFIDKVALRKGKQPNEDARRLVASEIRRVVERVAVYPASPDQPWDAISATEEHEMAQLSPRDRMERSSYFVVQYHSGEREIVQPNQNRTVISKDVGKELAMRKARGIQR